jgi:hypothetical protein
MQEEGKNRGEQKSKLTNKICSFFKVAITLLVSLLALKSTGLINFNSVEEKNFILEKIETGSEIKKIKVSGLVQKDIEKID